MAVVSAVGNFFASKSQNKNARRAADISERNNAANIALARDIYGQNRGILNPSIQRGDAAGNAINALLGLGGSQVQGGPAQVTLPGMQPNALSQFQGQMTGNAGAPYGLGDNGGFVNGVAANAMNLSQSGGVQPTMTGTTMPATGAPGMTPQQAQEAAFERFRNSTGYQFRVGEAQNALNSGFAGSGLLQSGAALRGLDELRQNMAANEFGNYLTALSGQQAVGAGAGSALAGVGQNFAGTVIGANNFNAQNQMAARLGQQNPFANALGTLGGGLQSGIGAFFGGGF